MYHRHPSHKAQTVIFGIFSPSFVYMHICLSYKIISLLYVFSKFCRETDKSICLYLEKRERIFTKLVHLIIGGFASPLFEGQFGRPETQGGSNVAGGVWRRNSLFHKSQYLVLKLSADWMRPHTLCRAICFFKVYWFKR